MLSRIVQVDVFNDVLPKDEGDDDVIAALNLRNSVTLYALKLRRLNK